MICHWADRCSPAPVSRIAASTTGFQGIVRVGFPTDGVKQEVILHHGPGDHVDTPNVNKPSFLILLLCSFSLSILTSV
jgi:hypothetical protein